LSIGELLTNIVDADPTGAAGLTPGFPQVTHPAPGHEQTISPLVSQKL
jgi:hypothetical protein